MAKVLEALIAKGRRVRRPREQKEVAFGLCDLSTHEELHERIVKKGGIKSLVTLLNGSSDNEAQRFAALALANVASAPFNRLPIVEEGVVTFLVEYTANEAHDLIARQYCAMAIGNLAAEPESHLEIVKCEGKRQQGFNGRFGGREWPALEFYGRNIVPAH
jgi:hypothetical protein